ncbi:DUF1127 domain-containing protein [Tropicimonas sp. TH_r6]|uniref:DUF1127 domain-containing protein n=1 Tax=Tropicimonas sp. TH_r6 TaxID=3082085 RepID=UPI0029538103|nr:DUF1127 domain-containing protein [Tropicimonas sp. TH_r6]MDV7145742.1 DUF1127 domain-containing protein [Tropicimonas sp. TH_r6]
METTLNTNASASWLSAPIATYRVRMEQYRTYRRTVRELSGLSDRALADLGLSRAMIKSLAREAAYGA